VGPSSAEVGAGGWPAPARWRRAASPLRQVGSLTNCLSEPSSLRGLDRHARTAGARPCLAQRVALLPACTRRSDDIEAGRSEATPVDPAEAGFYAATPSARRVQGDGAQRGSVQTRRGTLSWLRIPGGAGRRSAGRHRWRGLRIAVSGQRSAVSRKVGSRQWAAVGDQPSGESCTAPSLRPRYAGARLGARAERGRFRHGCGKHLTAGC
jgi:hypothetical protein